jgi:hypothetical protein
MDVATEKITNQPHGGEETVPPSIQRQTEQKQRLVAQQERHKAVISALINKTARIRKESKSRRHRVGSNLSERLRFRDQIFFPILTSSLLILISTLN